MTTTQYAKQGKLSEKEAVRLRSDIVSCPRCGRPATQGEIEDLGQCCSCDNVMNDVFDEVAPRDTDYEELQRNIRT